MPLKRGATTAALLLVALAPPAASAGEVVGCRDRSEATFPRAFSDDGNAVIGPWALVGAYEGDTSSADAWLRENRFWKMPLLLRLGRSATVTIPRALRDRVALRYGGSARRHRIRFRACAPGTSRSTETDRGPTTFWSGGVITDSVPLCLPLRVKVGDRATRTIRIPLGQRACSR